MGVEHLPAVLWQQQMATSSMTGNTRIQTLFEVGEVPHPALPNPPVLYGRAPNQVRQPPFPHSTNSLDITGMRGASAV